MTDYINIDPSTGEVIDIDEMINEFKKVNDFKLDFGKKASKLSADIKDYMYANKLSNIKTDKYIAKMTEKQNVDFNEEFAIEILKKNLTEENLKKVIKSKEYIDDDALEKLTYFKEFDMALLKPAMTEKEPTLTLRVSEIKK